VDLTPASNYGGAVDLSDHDEPELQYAEASPIDSKANVNVKEEEEEEENLKMPRHAVSVLHRVTEEKAPMDEMLIKESAIIVPTKIAFSLFRPLLSSFVCDIIGLSTCS